MSEAQAELRALLTNIFADGVVEVAERRALQECREKSGLSDLQIETVFTSFLTKEFDEAMADGKISTAERRLIATIVTELQVPESAVPVHVRMMLQD